jgi:N-acetylneuraminate lyase
MGQFDTMTVPERNLLTQAWIKAGHANDLYIIAHVGSVVQSDAISMAKFAAQQGADAIAAVPPYYEGQGSLGDLVDWISPICAAAPGLPFFYYHIPGATKWAISMHDFVAYAMPRLPCLKGIKYVDGNQGDFLNCVTDTSMKDIVFMWAPEPKLQSFAFPGRGTILAESFYAGTFLRMWDQYNRGNVEGARQEQLWKSKVEAIFARYAAIGNTSSDVAKRAVYTALCGPSCAIGLPRSPASVRSPMPTPVLNDMVNALTQVNFFNQSVPPWTPPKN